MITVAELVRAVVMIVVLGLIVWLLYYLINYISPPEPFKKVAMVVLLVFAVLICIGVLLSLAGTPLIVW